MEQVKKAQINTLVDTGISKWKYSKAMDDECETLNTELLLDEINNCFEALPWVKEQIYIEYYKTFKRYIKNQHHACHPQKIYLNPVLKCYQRAIANFSYPALGESQYKVLRKQNQRGTTFETRGLRRQCVGLTVAGNRCKSRNCWGLYTTHRTGLQWNDLRNVTKSGFLCSKHQSYKSVERAMAQYRGYYRLSNDTQRRVRRECNENQPGDYF